MLRLPRRGLVATALGFLMSGCGPGGPVKHPVSGTVLVNGKPAARINVCLRHTSEDVQGKNRSPVAVTDEDGRFTLSTDGSGDGAALGEYVVTFVWLSSNDPLGAFDRLGGAFADPRASRFRLTVPPPGNVEFRLEVDPKKLLRRKPAAKERAD